MFEEHSDPPPQSIISETVDKKPVGKYIMISSAVVLALIAVGGFSYFLGTSRGSTSDVANLSPTPFEGLNVGAVAGTQGQNPTSPSPTKTPTKKPTPTTKFVKKTLTSKAELDGFRSSNAGGNNSLEIRAGRNKNLVTRGFVSFDLALIPSGANVKKATLRLYQEKTIGDPYTPGGDLQIDHVDYGNSLNASDYATASIISSFAKLSSDDTEEWKEVDVAEQVVDDLINSRQYSQYRIHFSTETKGSDISGDFVYFEAAEDNQSSGNTPELIIEYS